MSNPRLSAYCIYTIRHTAGLDKVYQRGGEGHFTENTAWVTGRELLAQARQAGEWLPIVFGRAEGSVSELVYCGVLELVRGGRSGGKQTTYVFSRLTPITPPLQITRLTLKRKPYLSEQYTVRSLGIFGSYLRAEQKPRSDLDLIVEFGETPNLFEGMDLEEFLSDLLGVKVDLVMRHALKRNIGQRIFGEVVPI